MFTLAIVVFILKSSIYSQPFGGCEQTGLKTWVPGCSTWPDLFQGLAISLFFWALRPHHLMLKILSLIVVTIFAIFGGIEGISTGYHKVFFADFPYSSVYWGPQAWGYILGGLLGLITVTFIERSLSLSK